MQSPFDIQISPEIQEACPELVLACLSCPVQIVDSPPALLAEIQTYCDELAASREVATVKERRAIAATRAAYKALGKEPSRYRPSAEALARRVVQGKGLYQVNNVVDLLNLVSLQSGYSIGGWDADKIEGMAVLGVGREDEPYAAIGRGELNIASFPTFRDDLGAFGTPTSDSLRTMVRPETHNFLMVIYAFGEEEMAEAMETAKRLLQNYGGAKNVATKIIRSS